MPAGAGGILFEVACCVSLPIGEKAPDQPLSGFVEAPGRADKALDIDRV